MTSHESDQVKVPPNHAMEDANWLHEGSRWKCKINGCTNTYVAKWLFRQHLDNKHGLRMEVGKSSRPFTCVGGPRQQNHHTMNIWILSNSHARQKWNEKKAFDRMKKKEELEWDELQAQAQQMEQVKMAFISTFSLRDLIGHQHGGWGSSHKVHGRALKRMKTLLKQFGQVQLLMQNLWKLHGVFKNGHWNPINATESKKWMQYPSIIIPKSFTGGIFPYLYIFFKNLFAS